MKQLPKLLIALGPNATINDIERFREKWSQDVGETFTLYTGDYVASVAREHVERVALRMVGWGILVGFLIGFVTGFLAAR